PPFPYTTLFRSEHDVAELDDGEGGIELLYFAFDARLRFELHDDARIGAAQDVRMQLRLTRAIAADSVEVHALRDHLGREHDCIAVVGSRRRDDVLTAPCLRRRCTPHA